MIRAGSTARVGQVRKHKSRSVSAEVNRGLTTCRIRQQKHFWSNFESIFAKNAEKLGRTKRGCKHSGQVSAPKADVSQNIMDIRFLKNRRAFSLSFS